MFIKVADSNTGRVYANGTMSKPLTVEDRRRADEATQMAESIMVKAGAMPDSIRVTTNIGGHPGGTAALGSVVDGNLQVMGIDNLFVCDTAVFPCSPGRPPTLMLLAMARIFAQKLLL
jgi:choline dehydrogenase-like flavoprotein